MAFELKSDATTPNGSPKTSFLLAMITSANGLLKWSWRRLRRCLLGGPSRWLLFLGIVLIVFLLLPSQLYVMLVPSPRAGNSSRHPDVANGATPARLRFAAQVNQQLRRIELSLKENRQILLNIRNSINLAIKKNDTTTLASFHHRGRLAAPSVCDKDDQPVLEPFTGQINMEQVYERLPFDNQDGGVWKQGWPLEVSPHQFAPPTPKLKVFVVAHSHNDPGWIKTFNVYFAKQTRNILNNAVEQMTQHRDMKFIWAETSYLSAWWETCTEAQRRQLQQLVHEGRFEIVTGGWVMNDEANTHYWSIIAQMMEGHEWLRDHLGVEPRHGWAIDPFGLSPTMAYLLKAMGFRGMVIQRVHYSIKKYLSERRNLEFRWRQHWESKPAASGDIVCHLQPFYSYDVPHTCGPDPKICCQFDFKRLPPSKLKCPWKVNPKTITDENIKERAETLLDQYRKKSLLYQTKSLLVPLGDDFRFDDQKEWTNQYENYRKLMDYMNRRADMNVQIQFATLKDYFDSMLAEPNLPSLVGDFFTYCDRDDHYWSGYYTSKPFYKRFERILASHLRATEILFSFANIVVENYTAAGQDPFAHLTYDFMYARQNLALFQHHDGITGTAKANVVNDYAHRMFRSFSILNQVTTASLSAIFNRSVPGMEFMHRFPDATTPPVKHRFHLSDHPQYFVLYNPLGWTLDSQVFCFDIEWPPRDQAEMPDWCLTSDHYTVAQINHLWPTAAANSPTKRHREVCFQPKMAPLSLVPYQIGPCPDTANHRPQESFVTLFNSHEQPMAGATVDQSLNYHILSLASLPTSNTIENEMIRLTFDSSAHGLLKSWSNYDPELQDWTTMNVSLKVLTFGTRSGGKKDQKSGAYIFVPDKTEPVAFEWRGKPKIRLTVGPLESRYEWMVVDPYPVLLQFSLHRGRPVVELTAEFHLRTQHAANRELLIRFEIPQLDNGNRFYTDLNGFQMIARKRYTKIPLQGNVYPMSTMAWIEDNRHRFSVITGQPLGVTSLRSGTLEVFMDRRLLQDDFRGLNQAVLDNRFTRESFRLMLEPVEPGFGTDPASPRVPSGQMFESQTMLNPIIGMVSHTNREAIIDMPWQFLNRPFPCDLHMLNFRRSLSNHTEFGLWLHRTALNCHASSAQCAGSPAAKISLTDLFNEATLSRLQRRVEITGISLGNTASQQIFINLNDTIQIEPMQIGAYKLTSHPVF